MAEISSWACQHLARLNKLARLAWVGRKPRFDGEVDPGDYALVQLYPMRLIGSLDNPEILSELWDYTLGVDKVGNPETRRISRGRLFNMKGGLTRDYNPLSWIPVYVARFSDYGLNNEAVPLGGFRPLVEAWSEDILKRHQKTAEEQGRKLEADAKDIAAENTDFLWSRHQQDGGGDRTSTREERVQAEAAFKDRETSSFTDYYDATKVFKA